MRKAHNNLFEHLDHGARLSLPAVAFHNKMQLSIDVPLTMAVQRKQTTLDMFVDDLRSAGSFESMFAHNVHGRMCG